MLTFFSLHVFNNKVCHSSVCQSPRVKPVSYMLILSINMAVNGLFCLMKTILDSPLADWRVSKTMKVGMLSLHTFPLSVAFSSPFLSSALSRWIVAKQTPVWYSRTSPLPPLFLDPSNSTSATLIFQQLAMSKWTRWEIKTVCIYHAAMIYQELYDIILLNCSNNLMRAMPSVFLTEGNWVSKELWTKAFWDLLMYCDSLRIHIQDWSMEEFSH